MGISVNGPSGIDTQSLIDQLVALEQQKVTKIETQKSKDQVKIDAYSKLKTLLTDIKTSAASLNTATSFDLFKTSSSDEDTVTISGSVGSVDAQYDVKVFQLSATEKMMSGKGIVTSQNTALSSATNGSISSGSITIDGVSINVTNTDTIQDLRMKINNATHTDGKKLGVTASVLKVSDTDFRLVLTAKDSGSTGISYSGQALADLGIIEDATTGSKGITNQSIGSFTDSGSGALDVNSLLAQGERTVTLTGTDRDGRAINYSFIKKSGMSAEDFSNQISSAFHGMVDVTVDATSGALTINDKVGGSSQLSVSSLSVTDNSTIPAASTNYTSTTTYGNQGKGVLSIGKDAWYSVEGVALKSSTDKASGVVSGVTFELKGISADKPVKVALTRDIDGIKKKFQNLIDSYNALVRYKKSSTKVADPKDKNSKDGELAGDSTVGSILNTVRETFRQQFDFTNTAYVNFTMIGLKTDSQTGEFQLDSDKFTKAVETDLDSVIKMFSTTGKSDNSNVVYGRSTKDTQAGKYDLQGDSTTGQYQLTLQGTSQTSTGIKSGDIISFSSGPAKGLSITVPEGTIPSNTTFTLTKGLGTVLDESISKLNDSRQGIVSMRQDSLRKTIDYEDDRITQMNDRVERYRLRLVKQFSDMEQAMSKMQSQSTNAISKLSSNN